MPIAAAIPPTGYLPKRLAASGQVKDGPGILVGILCTESSTLILDVYDAASATGTPIVDNLSVYANEFTELPFECKTAIYVEFVSGSGKITVAYV